MFILDKPSHSAHTNGTEAPLPCHQELPLTRPGASRGQALHSACIPITRSGPMNVCRMPDEPNSTAKPTRPISVALRILVTLLS